MIDVKSKCVEINISKMSFDRDPTKRRVKPPESAHSLLDFDLDESSDDSDFRIEDHPDDSDDYSINSDEEGKVADSDDGASTENLSDSDLEDSKFKSARPGDVLSTNDLLAHLQKQKEFKFNGKWSDMLICAGCLGTRSDDTNEIVECDGCGVTVHEGCYGVSDVTSESSTVSSASTEPWFCEACKAGVTSPRCELCPNEGGIFKETEVGSWVHLVCALYIPGVAFSEVDRLSGVTLFEMSYSRWGRWACQLCLDTRMARTGVAVSCDAGLCKNYFHVTCGQREGLLSEPHSEEVEQADPFYAQCKMHTDKAVVKRRRGNWLALQLRTQKRKEELMHNMEKQAKLRIERKLAKYRKKYLAHKETRNKPWVPTQKMPRMLWSSPSAVRRFEKKAQLMGLDVNTLEMQDSQIQSLKDVSRRWHIAPAFSVEFVAYYLERNSRVTALRKSIKELSDENTKLLYEEIELRKKYTEAEKRNSDAQTQLSSVKEAIKRLHDCILGVCPNAALPRVLELPMTGTAAPLSADTIPTVTPAQLHNRMSRPTAAALKMGVGFPLSNLPENQGKVLSTSMQASLVSISASLPEKECGICKGRGDQHLLATCDTCSRHYHLACLRPPLTRLPKKSKLYGWQCSECDKSSDSEPEMMEKKVPRKSRTRYSKDGSIISANEAPPSPRDVDSNTPEKQCDSKQLKIVNSSSPASLKVKIKPLEFSSDANDSTDSKVQTKRKIKRSKQKTRDHSSSPNSSENNSPAKKARKKSLQQQEEVDIPAEQLVEELQDPLHDDNSNMSLEEPLPAIRLEADTSFLSANSSFTTHVTTTQQENKKIEEDMENTIKNLSADIAEYKANRKRRKEKHRNRYSPDLLRTPSKHKHKHKKKAQEDERPHPRITIKIKPIPKPAGSVDPQMFYVPTDSNDGPPPIEQNNISASESGVQDALSSPTPLASPPIPTATNLKPAQDNATEQIVEEPTKNEDIVKNGRTKNMGGRRSGAKATSASKDLPLTQCDICSQPGNNSNLVRCDECGKRYHFTCLEPPLSKNPKKRGYSWHCADCDPTDVEST